MSWIRPIFKFAVASALLLAAGRASADEASQIKSAVVFQGMVVCLGDGGTVSAWSVQSGKYIADFSARFSRKGLISLATDATKIWATDASTLYVWSAQDSSWRKSAEFSGDGESVTQVVVVGGEPLLIFPSKVKDPIGNRIFKAPSLTGQVRTNKLLGIHAVLGTDSMLWLGTGHGEWGGHLIGLTPKTAKWVQYYDALHYVNGIAPRKDGVTVSWSMSHFGANTLIRVHKPDASVEAAYPELESKYYQQIAYSSFDETLYGIEQSTVVSIREGRPTDIVKLHGAIFDVEPRAIGVAPGILAVIPVAPSTLVVAPKRGAPWLVRSGKVAVLTKP